MKEMRELIEEQRRNAQIIAEFIIKNMFNTNQCLNHNSSVCISCPYRYYCDYSSSYNDNSRAINIVLCES